MGVTTDKLRLAVAKMEHLTDERMRPVIAREIDRWGVQVHREIETMYSRLERQFVWLGSHVGDAKYEERFTQWERLLRDYETACKLLLEAEGAVG